MTGHQLSVDSGSKPSLKSWRLKQAIRKLSEQYQRGDRLITLNGDETKELLDAFDQLLRGGQAERPAEAPSGCQTMVMPPSTAITWPLV